jgi:hypothetical protein
MPRKPPVRIPGPPQSLRSVKLDDWQGPQELGEVLHCQIVRHPPSSCSFGSAATRNRSEVARASRSTDRPHIGT